MTVTIRDTIPDDLADLYAISRRTHRVSYDDLIPVSRRQDFESHYTPSETSKEYYIARMKGRLYNPAWHIWTALVDGRPVGYTQEKRVSEMLVLKKGLFVDPDYQGGGIGTALFERSIHGLPIGCTVRLSVVESNERAKRLYRKHGFEVKGHDERQFYGAPLLVMEKIID